MFRAEFEDGGDQFFEEVHFVKERVGAEGAGEREGVFIIGGGDGEEAAVGLEMIF